MVHIIFWYAEAVTNPPWSLAEEVLGVHAVKDPQVRQGAITEHYYPLKKS